MTRKTRAGGAAANMASGTVGGAIGVLLIWLGPQWGWFAAPGPEAAAAMGAAFGVVAGALVGVIERFLPRGGRGLKGLLPFALMLALGACAQDLGGITKVDSSFTAEGLPEISYQSGKEAASISAEFTRGVDGEISISVVAGDVKAFEGQAIQAERIKVQTLAITDALRDLLPGLISAALCAAGVGSDC